MKISKSIFAVLLTFTMVLSAVSVGSVAQAETNTAPLTLGAKENTDKTKEEKQKSYVEGEAVVLLEEEGLVSSGCSLSEALDVSGSIVVDDVENFSDKREGFSVATVSSKKLSTKEILKDLQGKEGVLKAGPNFIYKASSLTNDTYSDYQWALENKGMNGGTAGNDINPEKLWNETTASKNEPVVAVVDTGVDYNHPDLKDKMWVNPYPKKLKGTYGFDFTGDNKDLSPMDNHGHGTHCAGIIAAQQNNNEGIAGVSKDSKIMALKYLDSEGTGTTEDAVAVYNYIYRAMKLGVNVVAINNSWGAYMYDEVLGEIINTVGKMGAISVCAAGNESMDMDAVISNSEYYNYWSDWDEESNSKKDINEFEYSITKTFPACFDSEYVISVGATDEKGNLADYSNYGKKSVDVTAPGSNILSTVNYDCFIPNNYSDVEDRTQFYKSKDFDIKTEFDDGKGTSTVTEVKSEYFSDSQKNDSSIKWEIKDAKAGDVYTISIPYTAKAGEQNPYFSMMLRSSKIPDQGSDGFYFMPSQYIVFDIDGDSPVNYKTISQGFTGDYLQYSSDSWSHAFSQMMNNSTGNRKLVIAIACVFEGDYTLYFDNIGISTGGKNEESSFGKYDYYTGTSMATPAVTGAVALLKEKRSDLKPEEIVEKIKCSTIKTKSLEEKSISDGRLDLSKIDEKIPLGYTYKTENNKPTITGVNLSGATVTLDGKTVTPASVTDEKIVLNDTIRGNSTVRVETPAGYSVITSYITSGTKYTKGKMELTGLKNCELATDGKNIYSLSETTAELCSNSIDTNSLSGYYLGESAFMGCDLDNYFKDSINQANHCYSGYSLTYYGGYLYYIVDLSLISSGGFDEYASESVIVKMNVATKKYSFIKYDYDNIKKPSIAVYNNSLYLIGGYDMEKEALSTEVRKYSSSKWTTVSNLPTGRALGKCQQVGTSLVYTMGTDGTEEVPQNLVYDGKAWKESTASKLKTDAKLRTEIDGKSFTYCKPCVDLISGGLLYTGMSFGNMGDTVKYDLSKDKFTPLNYYYQEDNVNNIWGVVAGDKYIGTAYELCEVEVDEYDDEDWDWDWSLSLNSDLQVNSAEGKTTVTQLSDVSYTFKINTGMYNIKANAPHGKVTGTGYYVHGSKVSLTASANKGYKVKSITVNGKTYKGNKVSFTATKSLTVKVNYTTLVTSIKLNKKSLTMTKGEIATLKATVAPKKADNKKLVWQTSDKKVATVTQSGKVVAKKKGKCIITATAKDGSGAKANCKITVKNSKGK